MFNMYRFFLLLLFYRTKIVAFILIDRNVLNIVIQWQSKKLYKIILK